MRVWGSTVKRANVTWDSPVSYKQKLPLLKKNAVTGLLNSHINSYIYSYIYSSICRYIYTWINSYIYRYINSYIYRYIYSYIYRYINRGVRWEKWQVSCWEIFQLHQ